MGTRGVLAFDNDDANDWAHGLEDVADLSLVEAAFDVVVAANQYLEAPDASNALAACEVLARLKGNVGYSNSYTETVDQWVAEHPVEPPDELLTRASRVVERILGDNSELRELWGESDDNDQWIAAVHELLERLRS